MVADLKFLPIFDLEGSPRPKAPRAFVTSSSAVQRAIAIDDCRGVNNVSIILLTKRCSVLLSC